MSILKYFNNIYNDNNKCPENINKAEICHELKNPLNKIILAANLLSQNNTNIEQQKYINILNNTANDMKNIIENILQLNKINNDIIELKYNQININEFIIDIISDITYLFVNNKCINITTNIKNNMPILYTDGLYLKQVIINILNNSIKYSDKSRINNINLTVDFCFKNIYFIITDEGVGICEKDLENIFNPIKTKKNFNSSHLGLYLSNKIVKLLNGNIKINSIHYKGTSVIISIPIYINNIVHR